MRAKRLSPVIIIIIVVGAQLCLLWKLLPWTYYAANDYAAGRVVRPFQDEDARFQHFVSYDGFLPRTHEARRRAIAPGFNETVWTLPIGECVPWPIVLSEPEPEPAAPAAPDCYPNRTNDGQSTREFVHGIMREAWGADPPSVDLYVRAGSMAAHELRWLWTSVRLYWPRFLGRVILVLDDLDRGAALAPFLPEHDVLVAYEPVPDTPGRVFNQVSYLHLDRYVDAEYVVTLDSDCVLFRPVTPDALFNDRGELVMHKSKVFQKVFWNRHQRFFTDIDDWSYGHAMTTQPIAFRTESFSKYRDYVTRLHGGCYERRVQQFLEDGLWTTPFCWMCQLTVFLEHYDAPGYAFSSLGLGREDAIFRYGAHVSYEHFRDGGAVSYEKSANEIAIQSLCLWFGPTIFDECREHADTMYLRKLTITYASEMLAHRMHHETYEKILFAIKSRLRHHHYHHRHYHP